MLEKTDAARAALAAEYDEQSAVLKNLFVFEDSQSDLRGYAGSVDFAATYPFVDYQFKIMPSVLAEIRKHGNSGKHLSGGERSMLSGFQEAAQAGDVLIRDGDRYSPAPDETARRREQIRRLQDKLRRLSLIHISPAT